MTIPISPSDLNNVIQFDKTRISKGFRRRPMPTCAHRNLTFDTRERVIYCHDCKSDVEPFDVIVNLVQGYQKTMAQLKVRETKLAEAENESLHLLAAKTIEEAWRKKSKVPTCPSCSAGLHPEDFKHSSQVVYQSREFSEKQREKVKAKLEDEIKY